MWKRIQLYFIKRRIKKVLNPGFTLTGIEMLDGPSDNVCRITPLDGYSHKGDDCPCGPIHKVGSVDDAVPYKVIEHQWVEAPI